MRDYYAETVEIVSYVLGILVGDIGSKSRFIEDLEANDEDMRDIRSGLQDAFEVEISDDAMANVKTVGELASMASGLIR